MLQAQRVVEETVPGKQVTLAHVIASPITEVYESLGIEQLGAIGILSLSPYETAIIAADIAAKAADVQIGFLDRFTGSLILAGDIDSVETALDAVCRTLKEALGYMVSAVTRN